MRQSLLPKNLIQWLSDIDIQRLKIESCHDMYKEWLKDRVFSVLDMTSREKCLELNVWASTFDQIEEYFAHNID